MATEVRFRRGTTSEHSSFVGAKAEVTVDTDKNSLVVHDGVKQGGYTTVKESSLQENGGDIKTEGLTDSVTLSTGTLTIPVGMSTIKLPTSVWDGSSNITISAIAFEGGIQPAVGYEFSVVVPKTTDAGSLTAGALGNEVLIQDGASIAVEANNDQDLPCYPNAADNPSTDPVQFAAPYYRLDFRVDSYDGNGDPVVSLVRLPDAVRGSNDNGFWERSSNGKQSCRFDSILWDSPSGDSAGSETWNHPAIFSLAPIADINAMWDSMSAGDKGVVVYPNNVSGASSDFAASSKAIDTAFTGDNFAGEATADGEWY